MSKFGITPSVFCTEEPGAPQPQATRPDNLVQIHSHDAHIPVMTQCLPPDHKDRHNHTVTRRTYALLNGTMMSRTLFWSFQRSSHPEHQLSGEEPSTQQPNAQHRWPHSDERSADERGQGDVGPVNKGAATASRSSVNVNGRPWC